MAYVSHNARLACTPARSYSGVASIAGAGLMVVRGNWEKSGNLRNRFGAFDRVTGGTPSSLRHPASWIMAPEPGGMASRNEILATATLTGAGARGVNGASTIIASAGLVGTGQLVVSGAVSITATASLSGNVIAALAAAGSITASATFAGAMTGKGNAVASITAIASLTAPNYGTGEMAASITNVPQGVVTPGQILDGESVEAGLTVREALRLMAAALAGEISGAGTTTITIRNAVADDKDRIVATVDNNGNRTSLTYDLT